MKHRGFAPHKRKHEKPSKERSSVHQNNPNNKAYRANANNHTNQMNPNHKTHQQRHNSDRRYREYMIHDWAPDYIEYDD